MKLAVNVALSLAMLAVCLWLVWPSPEQQPRIVEAFTRLDLGAFWPYLAAYLALLATTHFCRAWRWQHLLDPIGVRLRPMRLLAISSVGFMAILALPARLGEFVRPALIRRRGEVSVAAALGTVAVERIVDGLLVSLLVFSAFFALRGPDAPYWMMPTAYLALAIFAAALLFLGFALRWPDETVRFAIGITFARKLAPGLATKLEEKLHLLISGFLVLRDRHNLGRFVAWSLGYWIANGLSIYVLARGFGLATASGLDLPLVGAFATMGLVAVGITLPNAPALAGQYQWFTVLGLGLYMGEELAGGPGLAFAIVLHGVQVAWYVGIGALALASRHVSFAEVVSSRKVAQEADLRDDRPDEGRAETG